VKLPRQEYRLPHVPDVRKTALRKHLHGMSAGLRTEFSDSEPTRGSAADRGSAPFSEPQRPNSRANQFLEGA